MDVGARHGEVAGTGIVARLMAVAEVEALWAAAEEGGTRRGRRMQWADRSVRPTSKRLGEMAGAAFLAKASRLRLGVACPWGDSERYDFIVHAGRKLWKVQVKSAHRVGEDGTYSFRAHGSTLAAYRPDEIDVLVAYVVPEDVWYVFPVRALKGLRSLKLFPGSRRRRSKFEKYREAWGILWEDGSKQR